MPKIYTITSGAYESGYTTGRNEGYQNGYADGEKAGSETGYGQGYEIGYNAGYSSGQASSTNLWSYILTIGQAPFEFMKDMLNFEIFGVDIIGLVSSLLTAALVVTIIRIFL